jgi:peptide/nickel transport system ATP-binding protein
VTVPPATPQPLLAVEGLGVTFPSGGHTIRVVDDVTFEVGAAQTVGLVGESGSGKTVTALSIMGLVHRTGGQIAAGSIRLDGDELVGAPERVLRAHRGRDMAMIFQQAARSLNPAFTVGDQIAEPLRHHLDLNRRDARARSVELLERVHIPDAARRARDYPHMFSGGMLQRVMIAMALACQPKLLIADEPTTALDVRVQASVLDLLREIQRDTGVAIVFVSHDLAVISEIAHQVVVMYAGQVVESGPATDVLTRPTHPYTAGLLASIPRLGGDRELTSIPGRVPRPTEMPEGCRFHTRCTYAIAGRCDLAPPALRPAGAASLSRCVRVDEIDLSGRGER